MRNIRPLLNILEEYEGLELSPYICLAGVPSIGYGTTRYPDGRKVKMTDPDITEKQAIEFVRHHLKADSDQLEKFLLRHKITLSDNKYCALMSLAYNCGIGPMIISGKAICEGLKAGSDVRVVAGIKLYNRATVKGKRVVVDGLRRRRSSEAKLYLS